MQAESAARSLGLAPTVYRDQSADDLRLSLIWGDLDLAQFQTFDRACLRLDWVAIDARIIGASHMIQIDLGAVGRVHEILACGPVVAGAEEALYSANSGALPDRIELTLTEGVSYRFGSEICRTAEAARRLAALEQRIEAARGGDCSEGRFGLRHDFPRAPREGPSPDPPCTLAWLALDRSHDAEIVDVETAHSYPNEGTVVFSTTQLSRRTACG